MGTPETVPAVIFEVAARLADREYVRHWQDGAWRSMTWAEFAEGARRIAAGLVAAGLEPGDRVAIISENRVEWLLCDLGIQAAGGVAVPVYPSLQPAVVQHIAADAGVRFGFASSQELAAKLGSQVPTELFEPDLRSRLQRPVEPAAAAEVERRWQALHGGDLATVVYTSGTTGMPKGAMLKHANLVGAARASLSVFDIGESDVVLSFLPYSHVLERVDGVFVPSSVGATIWLARSMDSLVEDIQAARPTVMLGVPRLFEKVYEAVQEQVAQSSSLKRALFRWAMAAAGRRLHGETGALLRLQVGLAERVVLHSLRERLTGGRLRFFISGGAPLNEKVEEFFWALGVMILQGWGLTESTSGASSNTETAHRYRTVGRLLPGVEAKLEPDGEILVRGPVVMAGYLNNPAATAAAIDGGWLRTGDMGFLDADGYLTITDRKKDLIKTSGGKYVAPLPIESRLESDHLVTGALVVGDGHPYCVALLVPNWAVLAGETGIEGDPGVLVNDERVRDVYQRVVDAANQGLASFETVKRFALLERDFSEAADELTPTLKPKRRVIAQHFADRIDALYEAGMHARRVAS